MAMILLTNVTSSRAPIRYRSVAGKFCSLRVLPVVYIAQPGGTPESLATTVLTDVCIVEQVG